MPTLSGHLSLLSISRLQVLSSVSNPECHLRYPLAALLPLFTSRSSAGSGLWFSVFSETVQVSSILSSWPRGISGLAVEACSPFPRVGMEQIPAFCLYVVGRS